MNHILIVDDETEIRESLQTILIRGGLPRHHRGHRRRGHDPASADAPYDVVLLDIWLPDRDGLDTLADIRQLNAAHVPEVVIISGHGTIEAAVRATKLGAYDFLEKPLSLDAHAHRAQERRSPPASLREENKRVRPAARHQAAAVTGDSASP